MPCILRRREQAGLRSAQGRAQRLKATSGRPGRPAKSRCCGLRVPEAPERGREGRYLGRRLPGLNGPQVLVQLRAQLGQLSLQKDLGAGYGERRAVGVGQWARWPKVRCEQPSGQEDEARGTRVKGKVRIQGQERLPACAPVGR